MAGGGCPAAPRSRRSGHPGCAAPPPARRRWCGPIDPGEEFYLVRLVPSGGQSPGGLAPQQVCVDQLAVHRQTGWNILDENPHGGAVGLSEDLCIRSWLQHLRPAAKGFHIFPQIGVGLRYPAPRRSAPRCTAAQRWRHSPPSWRCGGRRSCCHAAAVKPGNTCDDRAFRLLQHLRAQRVQHMGHGGGTVALLAPQEAAARETGWCGRAARAAYGASGISRSGVSGACQTHGGRSSRYDRMIRIAMQIPQQFISTNFKNFGFISDFFPINFRFFSIRECQPRSRSPFAAGSRCCCTWESTSQNAAADQSGAVSSGAGQFGLARRRCASRHQCGHGDAMVAEDIGRSCQVGSGHRFIG